MKKFQAAREAVLHLGELADLYTYSRGNVGEKLEKIDAECGLLADLLAQAELDAERLDWLERMGFIRDHALEPPTWRFGIFYINGLLTENVSVAGPRALRDAIDAAREVRKSRCGLCAAGYAVSDDGEHFPGDTRVVCPDWTPPKGIDDMTPEELREERRTDEAHNLTAGEPDFTTDPDPVDPTMEGWQA